MPDPVFSRESGGGWNRGLYVKFCMDMDSKYELKLVFFYSKYLTIYFNYPELLSF